MADLGAIVSEALDIYGRYRDLTRPLGAVRLVESQMGSAGGALGIPGVEVVGQPKNGTRHYLRWDNAAQRWVEYLPRRRRRRLLTAGDMADLAQLQALVGKGSQAMQVAVMRSIRRG